MTTARRSARRFALDVLYEAEIRDMLPLEAVHRAPEDGWFVRRRARSAEDDPPRTRCSTYARHLVEGVQEHHADIDVLIANYADRWAIERMPVIDRSLLRMALFELLWGDDIPVAVAINEAVELAKSLSTDDSGRFVNGLLGKIAEQEL